LFLFISEPMREEVAGRPLTGPSAVPEYRPPDVEVREALAGRRFWLIAFALVLVSTVTQGLVVHTVPLLTDKGYSPETAAALMIAVDLSTMAGRLLSGYLVDRISRRSSLPFSSYCRASKFTCSIPPSLLSQASLASAWHPAPK